jgi:methionyl-tRNA formyltransferase
LDELALGAAAPTPQNPAFATISRTLTKEDGLLDFRQPAEELERRVRAYQPWPGAYTHWNGKILKLLGTVDFTLGASIALRSYPANGHLGQPGSVVPCLKTGLDYNAYIPYAIVTGHGLLGLIEVQLEGKRPLHIAEFLRGYPAFLHSVLPS